VSPSLPLTLDLTSTSGVAEQIQQQILALVAAGTLVSGDRLPPVRTLAAELGVAPNTVAKAYGRLEHEGWVLTAGRRGTVVADQHPETSAAVQETLRTALQPLLDAGLSPTDVLRLVRSALQE
jgi:GntR family transcriptional regulator